MFKKRLAIFFLALANVILIGHDLIPHHHHDSLEELLAHHHSEQDQTEHGLSHWLSHLMHSSDGLAFSANHSIGSSFSKQQHSIPALLPKMNWIDLVGISGSIQKSPEATRLVSSLQCLPSGLRGPPALFS